MSGHIAGRKRTWPWVILSVLFAVTFVWSSAVGDGGVWSILRIGSVVGLGLSLLRLVLASISNRRLRRAQKGDEGTEAEAEGQPRGEEQVTEEPRTYEEVFGLQDDLDADLDAEGIPAAPEVEAGDGASTSEDDVQAPDADVEDVQAPHADVEEDVDQAQGHDADGGSEDHLQRIREEFRARAEEAALRVKQREAELQEASSVADQER